MFRPGIADRKHTVEHNTEPLQDIVDVCSLYHSSTVFQLHTLKTSSGRMVMNSELERIPKEMVLEYVKVG
jgi:hypothetical protein